MSQIPSSDYYAASDAGDIARLVACFSNRATVVDEGRMWGSTSSARTSRATSRAASWI